MKLHVQEHLTISVAEIFPMGFEKSHTKNNDCLGADFFCFADELQFAQTLGRSQRLLNIDRAEMKSAAGI
jgi:hypothetical protein